MNKYLGLIYAISAYVLWGIVPLFWKQISHIDSVEIVMHRMLWSCVLVVGLIAILGQWQQFKPLFRQPQLLARLLLASILVSINWAVFIWAVNAGFIVEASMGYFINPLISALFGFLIFKEDLRTGHWIALSMVFVAVAYLIIGYGSVPYVALTLASTFACYGAVKKTIALPATHGLAIETAFMVLPAAAYLIYLDQSGVGAFGADLGISTMLILCGVVTLVPLLLFAAAAKRVTLTALGMSQYVGPSLQLVIGVMIYNEPFGSERFIAFGLIWLAIVVFTMDELNHQRRRRRQLRFPG